MKKTKAIPQFKSFAKMLDVLPDEAACRNYLEQIRWNGKPTCPHCGFQEHYVLKTKGVFKGMYKCKNCRERYTVTVQTMFEGSHIPLRKWFIAMYIFSSHKKGISSHQLARDLGITQKSAWFVLGRIRNAYEGKPLNVKIDGALLLTKLSSAGKTKIGIRIRKYLNRKEEAARIRHQCLV
jgi:transposase-like protein